MATPFTHALLPLVVGKAFAGKGMPRRFWVLLAGCAVLPDLDTLGLRVGIPYDSFWGHRGFMHSLAFALLVSVVCTALVWGVRRVDRQWWRTWAFFLLAAGTHPLLDAATNGGLGVALFSPFDQTRYFAPWRPLVVSPIGIRGFFTRWGRDVLISEAVWVWLPLAIVFLAAASWRAAGGPASSAPRPTERKKTDGDCGD